jgi:hypothetical protein
MDMDEPQSAALAGFVGEIGGMMPARSDVSQRAFVSGLRGEGQ